MSAVLAGCGASGGSDRGEGARTPRGVRTAAAATSGQALTPDTVAYIEIARASGTLRGSAAATAVAHTQHLAGRAAAASAARRVAMLRPGDAGLATLQRATRSALAAALAAGRDPRSQRAAALAAVSATDMINRGLRRYAARRPQLLALVPD